MGQAKKKRSRGTLNGLTIAAVMAILILLVAFESYDFGFGAGYAGGLTKGRGETLLQASTYLALSPGELFSVSLNQYYGNLTIAGSGGFELACTVHLASPCDPNATIQVYVQHGPTPPFNSSYVQQGSVTFRLRVNSADGYGTYVIVQANPENKATAYVFWTNALIVNVTEYK